MSKPRDLKPVAYDGVPDVQQFIEWAKAARPEACNDAATAWRAEAAYLRGKKDDCANIGLKSEEPMRSAAGDAMRQALVSSIQSWLESAAVNSENQAVQFERQGASLTRCKTAVPERAAQPSDTWLTDHTIEHIGLDTQDDVHAQQQNEQNRQAAVAAFNTYHQESQQFIQESPHYEPPPNLAGDPGGAPTSGSGSSGVSSASTTGSGSTVGGAGGRYEGAGDTNPYMPGTQLPGQPGSLVPGNASGTNAANAATLPASQTPGVAGQPGAGPGNGPGYGVPGGPLGGMTGSGGGGRGGSSSGGGRGSTGARPVGNLSPGANPGAGGKGGPGSGAGAKGGLPGQVGSGGAKSGSPGMYPPGHPLARNAGNKDDEHETDQNLKESAGAGGTNDWIGHDKVMPAIIRGKFEPQMPSTPPPVEPEPELENLDINEKLC